MTERERLIELLEHCSCHYSPPCTGECGECHNVEMFDRQMEHIADHLLANGVIVPPCKVGNTVYRVVTMGTGVTFKNVGYNVYREVPQTMKYFIRTVQVTQNNFFNICENFGKTVFLTKEEAEKALKERSK